MGFPHEDEHFRDLLEATASSAGIAVPLVEKDYWVTHVLWSIQQVPLELWFKGGTSLSKGFQLIKRFSEDLDLKLHHAQLPAVGNWTSEGAKHRQSRQAFFEGLRPRLVVPGAAGVDMELPQDEQWRSANYRVLYPGSFLEHLPGGMRTYVLLEVGNARVRPFVERDLTSFVHDFLVERSQLSEYTDNRPRGVRCIHPLVTLLEKLEAISRHFAGGKPAPGYVRHYEDAAAIIRGTLPALDSTPAELYAQMSASKDLRRVLSAADAAFVPGTGPSWEALTSAHTAIEPMYWGPRHSLETACEAIRGWIGAHLSQELDRG